MLIERRMGPRLVGLAAGFPVVTITGPRQAGKTTLARQCFPEHRYVSLEDPDQRSYAREDPRAFLDELGDGAVLDEIQRVPDLTSWLQRRVDEDPTPGRWILTGSSNLHVHQAVSQSLAGRTAMLTLLPLDIDERMELAPTDNLMRVLWEGSFPAIHRRGLSAADWLGSYVETYVERDVRQVLNVKDLLAFRSFLELCAGHSGQLVNLSRLGAPAGVSHNTARSWLSVLEAAHLAWRLPSLQKSLGKRLVRAPKLHLVDSGLACWLLGLREPEQLRRHPLRGSIFETWMVAEVRKALTNHGLRPRMSFFRDRAGHEVDLVVERRDDLVAVEAKSGSTIDGSFFKELIRLDELVRRTPTAITGEVVRVLVHGGDQRQRRAVGLALPWRTIQSLDWSGARGGDETGS